MQITYDREVDALYIRFLKATVTTREVAEGIVVDYAADGRVAGIEILDASKRLKDLEVLLRRDRSGYLHAHVTSVFCSIRKGCLYLFSDSQT